MTVDNNITTTWGGALADLRDKLAAMTNWSIKDTSADGNQSPLPKDEWYVLSMAASDDDIRIEHDSYHSYIKVELGLWDSSSSSWTTKYNSKGNLLPASNSGTLSDTCSYWMRYKDQEGFVIYVQREEADGSDGDLWIGCAEIAELWDYDNSADSTESSYAWGYGGFEGLQAVGYNEQAPNGGNGYYHGRAIVNPDANFGNQPWHESIVDSDEFKNAAGNNVPIGTQDLMIEDKSGADSSHLDTIQDESGADIYLILSRNDGSLCMRID